MLPGGRRTICIIYQKVPGLDLHYVYTDPAQRLIMTDAGSTVDDIDHIGDIQVDHLQMIYRWII